MLSLTTSVRAMAHWPPTRWLAAAAATAAAALLIAVPTGIVTTSLYTRMTPVTWWDYPVWALSAALIGLTVATYVRPTSSTPPRTTRTAAAAILSTLAVGCPICNKAVVAILGVSGALSYWAPLQPIIGAASVLLLAAGLAIRLRGDIACPIPSGR
jgi:hypothetical protein